MPDQTIYEKLARYCAYQERSPADVQAKLKALKADPAEFAGYREMLVRDNYLNEERYIKAFVAGHLRKKWGTTKIKSTLQQKGINAALIKKHLDAIDAEGYNDTLLHLAQRKLGTLKADTPAQMRVKLMRFVLGKGYESSKVSAVVKKLLK